MKGREERKMYFSKMDHMKRPCFLYILFFFFKLQLQQHKENTKIEIKWEMDMHTKEICWLASRECIP